MLLVVCNEERELDSLVKGCIYEMDIKNIWTDSDGFWYAPIYDQDGTCIMDCARMERFKKL